MPRKQLIRSNTLPYHVVARANNKEPFHLCLKTTWEIFEQNLENICESHNVKIHAFVLMSNHFHLLITTPTEDLGKVMETFMRSVTRTINRESNRSGRIFGGPYHWSLVSSASYYDCVLKYIYRNPVKAGLSTLAEEYQFSTLGVLTGVKKIKYCIKPALWSNLTIPDNDKENFLRWINLPFPNEIDSSIKTGLRRRSFNPPRVAWKKPDFDAYALKKDPSTP